MDFLQTYAPYLSAYLPPSLFTTTVNILTTIFALLKTTQAHLNPLITKITTSPDLASILALLALLWISLKILDMAYRAVMFWVTLVLRLVLWGGMLAVGVWVYNRGVEGFVEDVGDLGRFWWGEYERFSGEVEGRRREGERRVRYQATKGYGQQGQWW